VITEAKLLVFVTKHRIGQQTKDKVFISQQKAVLPHTLNGYKTAVDIRTCMQQFQQIDLYGFTSQIVINEQER